MPTTTTVRISRETQQVLQTLAVIEGETIRGVLERAVSSYQRRAMLEEGNRAYAKLRENPKDWTEELEERRIWEATLSDGLKPKRRKINDKPQTCQKYG